jgi:MFS family permease
MPPPRPPPDRGPPDRGLDAVNLMVAAMGTAYGAFIPVYLTAQSWTQTRIGLVLTVSTIVSMLCQVPAGMWVDQAGPKRRRALWIAVVIIGVTPLVLVALPRTFPVLVALAVQAAAATLLTPAIAAVSLAVAGHPGLGERLGRNARYGSIGSGLGAAVMGVSSAWISQQAVFLISAALLPLGLLAVARIGPDRFEVTEEVPPSEEPYWKAPLKQLRNPRVVVFAASLFLFQLGAIAVLQLAAVDVTARGGARAGLVIAAFLVVPQAIVALVSPAIGAWAERYGRRPILIAGFATNALRALGFAAIANPYALVAVQTLEGSSGSVLGVMTPLVAADLTRGTRRYTLCLSLLGLAGTLGSALSTVFAGLIADRYGHPAAFLALALAGGAATLLLVAAMPETHPEPPASPRGPALAFSPPKLNARRRRGRKHP